MAVSIPPLVSEALWNSLEVLRRRFPKGRWVKQENYHLTLCYIGVVSEDQVRNISCVLLKEARSLAPISFQLRGGGVFQERTGSVFWAGVGQGKEGLVGIADSIQKALCPILLCQNRRLFLPHLTLARFVGKDLFSPEDLNLMPQEVCPVDHISLVQSVRNLQGVHYIIQGEFLLGGTRG